MFWGAFGYHGKSDLQPVPTKATSLDYQVILQNSIRRYGVKMGGRGWIFQQDNAPIHRSASTAGWFNRNHIRLMDWPARSPDLNPMENVWGYLARNVYGGGRQYNNKRELEAAITRQWAEIPHEHLQNLIESMRRRIFEVILKRGGYTGY